MVNIKKTIFILLINLLITTWSFSQTISTPKIWNDSLVVISLPQLKKTNLIFLEHRKLKSINEVLNEQNKHLYDLNAEYLKIDSIQKINLNNYSKLVQLKESELLKVNEDLIKQKKENKTKDYIIGGVAISTILVILISVLK